MKKTLIAALSLLVMGCQQAGPSASLPAPPVSAQSTQVAQNDAYLCSVESRSEKHSVLKVMNLQNRTIRSIYVPGQILQMEGKISEKHLYISSRQAGNPPQYALFQLNVQTLGLQRVASFNQAGVRPSDFILSGDKVFVTGKQGSVGLMTSFDLKNQGWSPIVQNIKAGQLDHGTRPGEFQNVFFDDEDIIRTTIDANNKRILNIQKYKHGVPFGNNIGLAAPHGDFFYALHQLKGHVAIFAFDINSGVNNRVIATETAVGVLYSSVISRDGRYLFATIDDMVQRFELRGTEMKRLPPIELNLKEARFLTLSADGKRLYVSHDGKNSVSQIDLGAGLNYQLKELPYPGDNYELVVF